MLFELTVAVPLSSAMSDDGVLVTWMIESVVAFLVYLYVPAECRNSAPGWDKQRSKNASLPSIYTSR
jgi:cyanate permease